MTRFEDDLIRSLNGKERLKAHQDLGSAGGNARGVALSGGRHALVDVRVSGRKYGISLDGTGEVLIKGFAFLGRRSSDRFGSGLILGQKSPTRGETWVSDAWIDLKEKGPDPDYARANNEAISVERGNARLNIRHAVLIGAQEAGLDNKGDVRIDASFIASGHRPVRIWNGASVIIANTTILAYDGYAGVWFGGGGGVARLAYFNCRFGRVGDKADALVSELPGWMIARDEDDPIDIHIEKLGSDPFDRSPSSFWAPARTPLPPGYLR